VNHAIGSGRSAAQAFQVFKSTSMHLGTSGDKRVGARFWASEAKHLMARIDEFLDDGRANEACGAGDENTHNNFSFTSFHNRDRIHSPG